MSDRDGHVQRLVAVRGQSLVVGNVLVKGRAVVGDNQV